MSQPRRSDQVVAEVVAAAREEAQRLGYPFIQREQLFLGLLRQPSVSRIFHHLGVDVTDVRLAMERRLGPGSGAPENLDQIGLLPTAENVLRHRAVTAAALLGHTHIGAEQILLGFLLEQSGSVVAVLSSLGVTRANLMETIKILHG